MMRSAILFALLLLISTVVDAQDRRSRDPKLAALLEQRDSILLSQELNKLGKSNEEGDLSLLANYYNTVRNAPMRDSINALAKEKFPNGLAAMNEALQEIYDEKDGMENERRYADFVARFGSNPKLAGHRYFETSKFFVASSFANQDEEKVVEWIEKIQDTVYKTKAYSYGCRELMANKKYETAEKLIRKSIADLERRSQTETAEYYEYAKAAAAALLGTGKYEEGFQFAKVAHEHSNGKDKVLNQTYLDLLIVTKQYKTALPMMEESVRTGQASPLIKENLKDAYLLFTVLRRILRLTKLRCMMHLKTVSGTICSPIWKMKQHSVFP